MIVHHQVVAGGTVGYLPGRLHHSLVVTVEEVNLETGHAQVGIVFVVSLQVADAVAPTRPEDDADTTLLGVWQQHAEVNLRIQFFGQ